MPSEAWRCARRCGGPGRVARMVCNGALHSPTVQGGTRATSHVCSAAVLDIHFSACDSSRPIHLGMGTGWSRESWTAVQEPPFPLGQTLRQGDVCLAAAGHRPCVVGVRTCDDRSAGEGCWWRTVSGLVTTPQPSFSSRNFRNLSYLGSRCSFPRNCPKEHHCLASLTVMVSSTLAGWFRGDLLG